MTVFAPTALIRHRNWSILNSAKQNKHGVSSMAITNTGGAPGPPEMRTMMKKKMTLGQKMRFVAGGTYTVLALYQMLCTYYAIQSMLEADMYYGWKIAILAIPAFAAMAFWMFASRKVLSGGARRGITVGTILVVCYELLTYRGQVALIGTALYTLIPGLYDNQVAQYAFMLARILLLVLACIFANYSKRSDSRPIEEVLAEGTADDDEAMPEAIIEETVVILSEPDEDGTED